MQAADREENAALKEANDAENGVASEGEQAALKAAADAEDQVKKAKSGVSEILDSRSVC